MWKSTIRLDDRLHSGQRPHTCPYCSKQFRHRSYFKVHVQAHQRSLKASGKLNSVPASGTTEEASNSTSKVTESAAGVVFAEPFEVTDSGMKLFFKKLNFPYVLMCAMIFPRSVSATAVKCSIVCSCGEGGKFRTGCQHAAVPTV